MIKEINLFAGKKQTYPKQETGQQQAEVKGGFFSTHIPEAVITDQEQADQVSTDRIVSVAVPGIHFEGKFGSKVYRHDRDNNKPGNDLIDAFHKHWE